MKKNAVIMVVMCVILFIPALLNGGTKSNIGVIGCAGTSVSDFKGSFFDVGLEVRFSGNFYFQFLVDTYSEPAALGEFSAVGLNSSAYGANVYGVYKFSVSQKLSLFTKLGVSYTRLKTSSSPGLSITMGDFGAGAGAGLEFRLSKKVNFVMGGTVKALIADSGAGTWLKFYSGLSFRLK
ncbi:MAG: outer membrane beta-barrel protein [bacterium]|nr:outer membrane beta-barrel protein [bacterium]